MIKLKDILLEAKAPSIFVPRRTDDRVERMIKSYIRSGPPPHGDLDLSDMNLDKIPEILKGITLDGSLNVSVNPKIKTLENSPRKIMGNFRCHSTGISDFVGGPEYVGRGMFCYHCPKLKSFFGSPKYIGPGGFTVVVGHRLEDIYGIPEVIEGDFNIFASSTKFDERDIRQVCDVKGKVGIFTKKTNFGWSGS